MKVDFAKKKIKTILGEHVKFKGKYEKTFENMSQNFQNELLVWVEKCVLKEVPVIQSEKYAEIIGFIKKTGEGNNRAMIIKRKNGDFIEFYLGNHKYYDQERNNWGF
ncbi:hypothetical protein ACFL0W_03515 [Nanoarchaeota archaeon]